jgi:hypothetical protein
MCDAMSTRSQDVVALYLRAQNLEQVRRVDEAAALYEEAVSAGFDAAGPYDRLIAIYHARDQYSDVARVAAAALSSVRTHPDKRAWYESVRKGSLQAMAQQPDGRGAEF